MYLRSLHAKYNLIYENNILLFLILSHKKLTKLQHRTTYVFFFSRWFIWDIFGLRLRLKLCRIFWRSLKFVSFFLQLHLFIYLFWRCTTSCITNPERIKGPQKIYRKLYKSTKQWTIYNKSTSCQDGTAACTFCCLGSRPTSQRQMELEEYGLKRVSKRKDWTKSVCFAAAVADCAGIA